MSSSDVGQSRDEDSDRKSSATRKQLDEEWASTDDLTVLSKTLTTFERDLEQIRDEPSKYPVNRAIYISIGIFVATIIAVMFAPIDESGLTNLFQGFIAKEGGGNKIQFALIMSVSAGMIPVIAHIVLRDSEKERRNVRLESLSLNMRFLRSKILLLKQEKAVKDLRRQ